MSGLKGSDSPVSQKCEIQPLRDKERRGRREGREKGERGERGEFYLQREKVFGQ